jgi:hypothetical protein
MHKRQQIRETLVRILTANSGTSEAPVYPTSCGLRVYKMRPTPLWESELPAICIYANNERGVKKISDSLDPVYRRPLSVSIDIVAQVSDDLDDILDGIAEQVEQVIGDNLILKDQNGKRFPFANKIDLDDNATEISLVDTGRAVVGSCRIGIVIPYDSTLGEAPDLENADDFERVNVKYETVTGAKAEDLFNVRTSDE